MAKKKVLEVKSVQLALLKSNPPMLSITTFGTVPTGGWKDPELPWGGPHCQNISSIEMISEPT